MLHEPELEPRTRVQERLDVVVINDFASVTGGADRVALIEAEGLARRGHRVTLIAGQGTPSPELLEAGVTVHTTGQRPTAADPNPLRAATQGIWNSSASALGRQTLGGADPRCTVVHIHGFTKILSASIVRAAVRSGLPTLATLHDYFAACPNGGFFNYQTDEICHLEPLSRQCLCTHCDSRSYAHKLWRVARTTVQRSVGAMPSGVRHLIVPSESAGGILAPFLPTAARLHIVANPIAVPRREPAEVAGNAAFVFIGRLQHDKGPALFARAARQAQIPAVFVGAGDEAELIRRENPEAQITGWLAPDHVQDRLRQARALVSPPLWYEVQGLAPLEAAAHGVPTVVSDVSMLRDLVADGQTGLWFRGGDVDDLSRKLTRLAQDDQLTRTLGANAYDRFWSGEWDVDTHLDRIEAVYRAAQEATRLGGTKTAGLRTAS